MGYDVIILGVGLAGLMAADAAQSQGAKVLVLAKGLGTLPLTTGCIDGLGYYPLDSPTPLSSPLAALSQLMEGNPDHPYAKVGRSELLSAFDHFQELSRRAGIHYSGQLTSNYLLPTPLGTFHPTCLVPETMKKGDLSLSAPVLLLGFEGLKDFSPFLAAENFNLCQTQGKIAPTFRAAILKGLDLGGKTINGLTLAEAFDQKDFRGRLIELAKPLLKPGERLGLPAVLGLQNSEEVQRDLEENLKTDVFEVPLPPPSVSGIRLFNRLKAHLQTKGVRIFIGLTVLQPVIEARRIVGFALGDSMRSPVYRAKSFVLATGKFVGGGLDSDRKRIYETLLDLPVQAPTDRRNWFRHSLISAEGQPFNLFGVEVDKNLQPIDQGKIVYENLFAAGGIIAHADSMSEKSGGGIAIATGYSAGKRAAVLAAP